MDIVQRADRLRQNQVFGDLRAEELAGIAALVDEQRFKKGHRLSGEEESYLYVVVDGQMGMMRGEDLIVSAGPGDVFFDPGLLDGQESESEMVALEDTRALRLSRLAFTRIMEERFTVVRGLLRHLGGVIRGEVRVATGTREAPTKPKPPLHAPWTRARRPKRAGRSASSSGSGASEEASA
jgi:CRP-like cAMP-binding protein